jgi:protease-4
MTRKGCITAWLIGVVAIVVIFLVTIIAIEALLGERVSLPAYGARVGLIRIEGLLSDARLLIEEIDTMEATGVSALVFRIESPGGGVVASQEIYARILELKETGIPIVVSMGAVAASGGYYIASPADSIIANPGTITGSIGVLMSFTNLEGLFEKIGMDFEVVKSGEYKDVGSWSREMTEEERAFLQATVDDIHAQFVEAVAANRNLERAEVEALADGRIFSGRQAVDAGLVDGLGTLDEAIAVAGRMAGIPGEPRVQEPVRYRRLTLADLLTSAIGHLTVPSDRTAGAQYLYRPAK